MKINLADSTREPSLISLHQIMREVAEDARNEQKKNVSIIEKAIKLHLAKLKKAYNFIK